MPVATGILSPVSKDSIRYSLRSIFSSMNFILSLIAALYLVRTFLPDSKFHHDIAAYLIAMFLFMSVIFFVLELLKIPVFRYVILPLTERLSLSLGAMRSVTKRIFGGLWQLPKAVSMVLIYALLLNFYASFINNPAAEDYINSSKTYQAIHRNILNPVLSTELVKKVPVAVSDAFRKAAEELYAANSDNAGRAELLEAACN